MVREIERKTVTFTSLHQCTKAAALEQDDKSPSSRDAGELETPAFLTSHCRGVLELDTSFNST